MDYLSMRVCMIQTDEGKLITLDNYAKIQKYLVEKGMEKCNPRDAPITEDLIKAMHNNKGKPLSAMNAKLVKEELGKFSWLADTVHHWTAEADSFHTGWILRQACGRHDGVPGSSVAMAAKCQRVLPSGGASQGCLVPFLIGCQLGWHV